MKERMDENSKLQLIQYRIERAEETLKEAELPHMQVLRQCLDCILWQKASCLKKMERLSIGCLRFATAVIMMISSIAIRRW